MGAGGSFGPPALQRGGPFVLEPADQLGGGVVGGYLAGQPDVDLDRGMVIRANVNGVGPPEDQPPDRLSDQQAGQIDRAAGADWPGGIKRAQPPCPALIDADDSSAVARSPDWGGRNQLTQRFQFLPSCRSFIGLALCTGHPPIRGGHLSAAGPLPLPFLPSRRSLVGLALCTGCPPIRPAHRAWLPSLGMASRQAIRALAAAAERLQATARCRRRPAVRTAHLAVWRVSRADLVGVRARPGLLLANPFASRRPQESSDQPNRNVSRPYSSEPWLWNTSACLCGQLGPLLSRETRPWPTYRSSSAAVSRQVGARKQSRAMAPTMYPHGTGIQADTVA